MKQHEGEESEFDLKTIMPGHLGSFLLSISKKIIKTFIRENNGFKTKNVYFTDNGSLYIVKKHWDVTDKAKVFGEGLVQSKKEYKSGSLSYGLFLAPKKLLFSCQWIWYYLRTQKFKGSSDCKGLLVRQEFLKR